ncbi:hypothetical protein AMK59_6297, partial [Oryctes borbonicus]
MFRRSLIRLFRIHTLKANNLTKECISRKLPQTNSHYLCSCRYSTNIQQTPNLNITQKLTEEEYLVKVKDDPDTFGIQTTSKEQEFDEGDMKEGEYLENPPDPSKQLRTKQYADMIKAFIRKRQIKEAIDVLEVRMLKDDRVKPENYIYNLLLGACGKVGYTKKAFSLYNKMKQRGLKVTGGTYTALFNACANSPWPEDGLTKALHLRQIMIEKGYEPNDTNYNAMIKAFGRCGDLETAFGLVDEMQKKNIPIKGDTLNFLLQACITDKETGFRHALLVWRKFIGKNIIPNVYSYNLLLRCTRDCGLGDIEITKDVLNNIVANNNLLLASSENIADPNEDVSESTNSVMQRNESSISIQENRPNLIARVPHIGNILSVSEITKPEDRLLLIGGFSGILKNMQENNCTPNIKTFTQLLDSIPSTLAAEKELLSSIRKYNVKPDVDFYNMLIKKRSMRFDYDLAKEVLNMIKTTRLEPNIITFGVLALGCQTKEEAESLIEEMHKENYRLNPEILGAMLHQACHHCNFSYVLKMMEICLEEEIRPNKKFMDTLEEFKKKCKVMSNDKDCEKAKSRGFQKGYQMFKLRYTTWKQEVDPINEDEIHPWQQFRQETKTDVKHYKDKSNASRFKARHTSLYRRKKNQVVESKKDIKG